MKGKPARIHLGHIFKQRLFIFCSCKHYKYMTSIHLVHVWEEIKLNIISFQPLAPLSHWESLDVWNWRFSRNQLRKVWMAWEVQFEIDPRNSWLHHVRGIKQHLSFDTSSKQCSEETEFWTKNRVRVIPNPTCTNLMCLAVCPIKKQTNKPMWIIARRTLGLVKTQPRNTF